MTEIIIKDDDKYKIPGLINPNTGETYDDSVAQDRTGMLLQSRPKNERDVRGNPKFDLSVLARKAVDLDCINCNGKDFRIFVDSHPQGHGACQFQCVRCKFISPVFQLKVPDMNDFRAKRMGLVVPEGLGAIVIDSDDLE
jgi:hypothetical protein